MGVAGEEGRSVWQGREEQNMLRGGGKKKAATQGRGSPTTEWGVFKTCERRREDARPTTEWGVLGPSTSRWGWGCLDSQGPR